MDFKEGDIIRMKKPFFCEGCKKIISISESGVIRYCDYLEFNKPVLIEVTDKEDIGKYFKKTKAFKIVEKLKAKLRKKKFDLIRFLEDF